MAAPTTNFALLALGLCVLPAAATQATLSSAAFTGLGITPNARILDWGRAEAAYENQLPGIVNRPAGHNYVLGFGLLPNLEIAGRLAANDNSANCFTQGCGARDLSASGKFSIGLDARNQWRAAVGATDIGGSVTYFRTYYGVLTWQGGPFEASGGWARRTGPGINGSRSPLDGPFASAAWQPFDAVRAHVEYTDGKAWAGVRVFAPDAWVPDGWKLSLGANMRLADTRLTERAWWGATVSIPLYKVPAMRGSSTSASQPLPSGLQPLPAYEARVPAPAPTSPPAAPSEQAPAPAAAASDSDLQGLADALAAKGLDDIWVGRMQDGTIAVRANNGSYRWNSADALGAALGVVGRGLSATKSGYRLVMTERQVPLVAVTGQADCLRQWVETSGAACAAGQLTTPGRTPLDDLHRGADWVVRAQQPAWKTLRVTASPVLRTAVGTEFGVLDYSLAANVGVQQPLWAGASAEWSVDVPVARSDDFEPAGYFGNSRIRSGTRQLSLTQTLRVPLERFMPEAQAARWGASAVNAQLTVGRMGVFYDGILGGLRWEPGDGRHRWSVQGGAVRNNTYANGTGPLGTLKTGAPLLASYRYSFLPTRTDLEATAGQFVNNDKGLQLTMRQWFADVAVSAYYKRTKFPIDARAAQLLGVEVSLPIGPRRDWRPVQHLQFGGTPRFAHSIETTIRENAGNPIRSGHAARLPVPGVNDTFNSDRSGLAWFEDNVRRIRDAAR